MLDMIASHVADMDAKTTSKVIQKLARAVLWNDVSLGRQALLEDLRYTLLQRRVLLHCKQFTAFECANVIWSLAVFCDLAPGSDGELTFYHALARCRDVYEDLKLPCIQVLVVSFARHRIEYPDFLNEISVLGLELLQKKKDEVVAENVSEILWGLSHLDLGSDAREFRAALFGLVENHCDKMCPWDVGNTMFAYASALNEKGLDLPKRYPDCLPGLLGQAIAKLGEMAPRGVLQLLWATTQLSHVLVEIPDGIGDYMDAFLSSVKSTIDKVRTDDNISGLVNLARLHLEQSELLHKNPGTWSMFYQVMDCYANDIDQSMDRYTARDLADAMWSFATVGFAVPMDIIGRLLDYITRPENFSLLQKQPDRLVKMVWACGSLFYNQKHHDPLPPDINKFIKLAKIGETEIG